MSKRSAYARIQLGNTVETGRVHDGSCAYVKVHTLVEYINILDVFNIYNPAIRPGNGIL
jgi:hypothetical protein